MGLKELSLVNTNFLFVKSLISKVPKYIISITVVKNLVIIYFHNECLCSLLSFLKKHVLLQYSCLIDITAIDYLGLKNRFEVVYQLTSIVFNHRILLKTVVSPLTVLASSTLVFNSAGWLEREVWDMFGIFFSSHFDLRRILTDYGFQGFPLRKDFPLTGFVELRYDDELKRVLYESLELAQEFRFFDFQSPWQNTEFVNK